MAKVIEISSLNLGYVQSKQKQVVLENLNLSVEKGEFLAIVGPSGVGKSTLLRVIMDLNKAFSGDIKVLSESSNIKRATAMVFQEARLLPWRKALKNVMLGLEGLKISDEEKEKRAKKVLQLVGLYDLKERFPHQLSGGQRQRIGLARALAVKPDLLLMDEPFASLDAISRQYLQDELLRIWKETKKSVLFVTHDISEAVYLADRVILLAGKPAHLESEFKIDVQRPRKRESTEMLTIVKEIQQHLSQSHPISQ